MVEERPQPNALFCWLKEIGETTIGGRRHAAGVAALSAGCSPDLLERMAAGEVEPERELAIRLHLATGGAVPVSSWPSLAGPEDCTFGAIGVKTTGGTWAVAFTLGGSVLGQLTPAAARRAAADLERAAHIVENAGNPVRAVS